MIVCICNNVSEGKIHQAVREGTTSMSELRRNLGVANTCGKCHSCAKSVLKECLSQQGSEHVTLQAIAFPNKFMPA